MERKPSQETINNLTQVVRIFPIALKTPELILHEFGEYKNGLRLKVNLSEIYLGKKAETSIPSPSMINAIGGKITGKDLLKEAIAKMNETCTLICIPSSLTEGEKFIIDLDYTYRLPSAVSEEDHSEKRVSLLIMPVVNLSTLNTIYPNQEKTKFVSLVSVDTSDIGEVITSGCLTDQTDQKIYNLVGHLTKRNKVDDIEESKTGKKNRKQSLNKLIRNLQIEEKNYRQKLLNKLSQTAEAEGLVSPIECQSITLERLMALVENRCLDNNIDFNLLFKRTHSELVIKQYMNYFKEVEIDSEKRGLYEPKIIKKNWQKMRQLWRFLKRGINGLADGTKITPELLQNSEIVKSHIMTGNFGTDMLHFVPLFSNLDEATFNSATEFIKASSELLFGSLELVLKGRDFKGLNSIDDLKNFFESKEIILQEKQECLIRLNKEISKTLSFLFQRRPQDISFSWNKAIRVIPELAELTKGADTRLSSLYQFHEPLNEIANASLAQTILFALGIDQKVNGLTWPKLKFEALRQLAFFMNIVFESEYYYSQVDKLPNPISMAIDNFFGTVAERTIGKFVDGYDKNQMRIMPIELRGREGLKVIIDRKPMKSEHSFYRKAFEEDPRKIRDIFSTSIVLAEEETINPDKKERITKTNQMITNFLAFIKNQYPDYILRTENDEDTFNNFFEFLETNNIEEKGKRTGSVSSKIIRRKIELVLTNAKGTEYYFEIAFYPFESLKEETNGKLFGWKEKLSDDPSYSLRRMLYPLLTKDNPSIGLQALYYLLYPASIYPEVFTNIAKSI